MSHEEIKIALFLYIVTLDGNLLIHHRFRDGPPSPLEKVEVKPLLRFVEVTYGLYRSFNTPSVAALNTIAAPPPPEVEALN